MRSVSCWLRSGTRSETAARARCSALLTDATVVSSIDADSAAAALNGGYHLAYLIGAGLVAVAIAVAAFVLEGAPKPAKAAKSERVHKPAYSQAS